MEQLRQLEQLCADFYSADPAKQGLAHRTLFPLVSNIQNIPQFQAILAQSQDPQAILFAANALLKLFTSEWFQIEDTQKKTTRSFLLSYLYREGKNLLPQAPITVNALVRLLVRIVKLQWLEDASSQNICDQVAPFLASSTADWVVGVSIYCELTRDMAPSIGGGLARARRTAFSFRDTALPLIFRTAIETLQQVCSGAMAISNPKEETQLLKTVLQLTLCCLKFDFMATLPDETSDDKPDPVMIPASWTIVKEVDLPNLFFSIYTNCCQNPDSLRMDCARLCMECLVQTASLRRSFFTREDDRARHLSSLIKLTSSILSSGIGISFDDNCYHEFCRLLGKMNTSVPLYELKSCLIDCHASDSTKPSTPIFSGSMYLSSGLMGSDVGKSRRDDYSINDEREWSNRDISIISWIKKVCEFTLAALERWTYQQNSKHYLMSFWNALVSPILNKSQKLPKEICECVQLVFRAFVDSCLKIGEVTVLYDMKDELSPDVLQSLAPFLLCDIKQLAGADSVEDPLEHEVFRSEQLDVISSLSKVNYQDSVNHIMGHWQQTLTVFTQQKLPKIIIERRVIWMIYIVGALIGGQKQSSALINISLPVTIRSYSSGGREDTEENEQTALLTHEVAGKVLRLMTGDEPGVNMNNLVAESIEHYELACLYFMESFRKIYFSDIAQSVHDTARFGIDSNEDLLTTILSKLLMNLKTRHMFEEVLKQSLALIHNLSSSVMMITNSDQQSQLVVSGRLILKSPVIISLLTPQGSREIVQCLDGIKCGRYRTSYYCALTKLFFLSVADCNSSDSGDVDSMDPVSPRPKTSEQVLFHEFMAPLADVIAQVWPASAQAPVILLQSNSLLATSNASATPTNVFARQTNDAEQKVVLASLFRDLRGICQSCLTSDGFLMFFNWLVNRPKHMETSRIHIISLALEHYWDCYPVAIAALRFAVELTSNKTNRINFSASSPNGIILFREVSTILSAYAPRLLGKPNNQFQDLYREKYKGLAATLQLFFNASAGNFANLGAFKAYGDEALPAAIRLGIRMCLAIPEDELQSYTKILKPYYAFLELITRSHMMHLLELESSSLTSIIRTLEDGICSFQATITLQSWASLYNLTKYFLVRLEFDDPVKRQSAAELPSSEEDAAIWKAEAQRIRQFFIDEPNVLKRVLQLALQLVIHGESGSTWALSGALLGLILLHPEEFQNIQASIVEQQKTEEKRQRMQECFEQLMQGVEPDLTSASKERFTRNLYLFPQNIRTKVFFGN